MAASNRASGTIVLITGANKGLGLESARQLAARGCTVLVGARDAARGEAAAASLRAAGDVRAIVIDVTSPPSIDAAARRVEAEFGRLDVLVNNAGIAIDFGTPASHLSAADLRTTMETNVVGVLEVTRAFLPLLKKSPAGRIVNLSSILGSLSANADPSSPIAAMVGSCAAYAMSKAALNMLTVHLARELAGTRIKVNAAHPGWVKTDMGGPNAPLEVEPGARTTVDLALLGEDGPTGGFFHMRKPLGW